jgi:hypothetical protein
VASYAIYFTWAPLMVAPGAVLLAREGLARARQGQGKRGYAISGGFLGLVTLAFGAFLIIYALLHQGDYPFGPVTGAAIAYNLPWTPVSVTGSAGLDCRVASGAERPEQSQLSASVRDCFVSVRREGETPH